MPAYFRATVAEFLTVSESELIGHLTTAYARSGFEHQRTTQTLAWASDLLHLQHTLHVFAKHYSDEAPRPHSLQPHRHLRRSPASLG
jgi:hypothetical protein